MREIVLRAGESMTIGDTKITAACSSAKTLPAVEAGRPSSLLSYLNSLSVGEQTDFAGRCGTTIGYMRQVAYGNRRCRESLAINMDRESGGAVRMEELRPDVDWDHVRSQATQGGEVAHG